MINKLLLTSGNQWNIIYVFIETLHTYSLRIEILVAIDFFHHSSYSKNYATFTLLATCFIIVGILSLTYPFTHLQ
jgi:hypothetical protein